MCANTDGAAICVGISYLNIYTMSLASLIAA